MIGRERGATEGERRKVAFNSSRRQDFGKQPQHILFLLVKSSPLKRGKQCSRTPRDEWMRYLK